MITSCSGVGPVAVEAPDTGDSGGCTRASSHCFARAHRITGFVAAARHQVQGSLWQLGPQWR